MAKRFNLNNYEIVSEEEATHIIVPFEQNGVKQPNIYLRSKRKKIPIVSDTNNAEWTPTVLIDERGTPKEYTDRIKWWFANASLEYKDTLRNTFKNLITYNDDVRKANGWLLTTSAYTTDSNGKYIKRKKNIGAFLSKWLTRSQLNQDRRQ